jgi:hypothetical protein
MIKTTKIVLGGKERTLCFSQMGFIENIHEVSGKDAISFLNFKPETPKDHFEHIRAIIHAGLITGCDIEDKEPDFDDKQVRRWVKSIDYKEAAAITSEFVTTVIETFATAGEVEAQTNQQEQVA